LRLNAAVTQPSRSYRWLLALLRLLVRAFFRRVHVSGHEHVPADGGGIVVSWHPNGLIDPGLVLTQFPRQVVFGARHGLFKYPLLGQLLRAIGTVPIYRAVDLPGLDAAARAEQNQRSLDALAAEIARGSFSALFPEGRSHDAPHLSELKTGAARLYYQARSQQPPGSPPAIIIPVGLHYDDKDIFRSNAMVEIHPPIAIEGELDYRPDLDDAAAREQARALTAEIEHVLTDVVLATESWPLHKLMHRARKLIRAERAHRAGADPGKTDIAERVLGFARIRTGYQTMMETQPEKVQELVRRVDEYDADLAALYLDDHELDRDPRLMRPWLAILLLVQVLGVFLLLPPVLVIGYLVNTPAALALLLVSRAASRQRKDEATVKLLVGAILFPLTWIAAGIAAGWGHGAIRGIFPSIPDAPLLTAFLVAGLAAVGGAAALRYLRVARETARAMRVRLTRRLRMRAVERLRAERAALCDAIVGLGAGVELPGEVLPDGRVVREVV
jgi:glycerol-3-phosphate O-acyltransferase / dihydroxyacetone phosphate acyltransferase